MNNKALRTVIENARRLSRAKASHQTMIFSSDGRLLKSAGSGDQVRNCPGCGAPVVDSAKGIAAHLGRRPECREAWEKVLNGQAP